MRILTEAIVHPLNYRLLIFDLDGTLRGCTEDYRPPNTLAEQYVLPNVCKVMDNYRWGTNHYFGIVTNQGGVGLGYVTREVVNEMISKICNSVWGPHVKGEVNFIDFGQVMLCPHAPGDLCACRKPSPYLILHLMLSLQSSLDFPSPFRFTEVLFIGDQPTDYESARRANVDFCWARDFFGWA